MKPTKISGIPNSYQYSIIFTIREQLFGIVFGKDWRIQASWDVKEWYCYLSAEKKEPVLGFDVNGTKFQGHVRIFHDEGNFYRIEFIKDDEVVKYVPMASCYELNDIVDEFVERQDWYVIV